MSILNCIIFGPHGKRFQKFQKKLCLVCAIILVSQFSDYFFAGIVKLVCWSVRLLLRFLFNSLDCISGLVLLCFLFRRLTLFFRFTFVHTAKLKKSNFLNDFFLLLTAYARVTSFLTRFSKSV